MDSGTLIAEVARRDGVLLDRNDPVIVQATALDVVMAEHRRELDAMMTDQRRVMEAMRQPIPQDVLRNAVIMGVSAHASGVVRALNWRNLMTGLAGLVVFGAACGVGGWWVAQRENANAISWGRAAMSQCETVAAGSLCHPSIKVGEAP